MGTKNFSNANDLITFSRASGGTALRKIAYGSELVTNGTFDGDLTGWAGNGSQTIAWDSDDGGSALIDITGVGGGIIDDQSIATKSGSVYAVSVKARLGTYSGSLFVTIDGVSKTIEGTELSSSYGTYTFNVVAADADLNVVVSRAVANTGTIYVSSISVKEVLFDQGTLTLFNHPAGIPRIEYDADGNVLGLLVEESRTNLVTYSEERNQWTKGTIGVTDGALSINGLSFSLLEAGLLSTSQITIGVSVSPGATVTYSDYVKAGTSLLSRHGVFDSVNSWAGYVDVGWSSGVPSTSASSGASNIEYEDIGNGVYRISFSVTINASPGGITFHTHPDRNATGLTLYVSGAQLEAGAFPTSYIPTSGATATRSADAASIPVADFGYSQSVGSVVVECENPYVGSGSIMALNEGIPGNSDNRIIVTMDGARTNTFFVTSGGVNSVAISKSIISGTPLTRFGISWEENDATFVRNADTPVTDTSATIPNSLTKMEIGSYSGLGAVLTTHIKSIKYFPRKLTDAQLQELTT